MSVDRGITMRFHRFNQFVLLPLSLLGSIVIIVKILQGLEVLLADKSTEIQFMYVSFYAVSAVLNIISQTGFIHYRGYSYYSYLSMQAIGVVISFFSYSYVYDIETVANILYNNTQSIPGAESLGNYPITALADFYRTSMGVGIIVNLAITVLIVFYYMKRRCVFEFKDSAEIRARKKHKKMWTHKERYTPEKPAKLSRTETTNLAGYRLNKLSGDAKKDDDTSERDIF